MKRISKKISSMFLILCMVLTLLPAMTQPVCAADATSLKSTVESAGLSAQVNGNTVTVTGTATGTTILLDIGEGITVVWNASYTTTNQYSSALDIKGTGTFRIIGGTLIGGSSTVTTAVVGGSPLFIVDGGENTLNSGGGGFIYWSATGGKLVYLSGILTHAIKKNNTSSVIAFYSENALKSTFDSSWTAGTNLLPLKNVMLIKSDDSPYAYQSSTAFSGTVTATLPDVLDLSNATVTPSVSTTSGSAITVNANKSVSYSGTLHAEDLSLTVSGATVGDVPIATFSTPVFKINVTPFVPVTDITQVPAAMELGESLSLSGTIAPTDATKKNISWSIKDAGTTHAILNGDTLSATTTGTVTVTASITDGSAYGSAYVKDFVISVTASTALSINPASYTFDNLEEGYLQSDVTPISLTISNKRDTILTGLVAHITNENAFSLNMGSLPSTLAPNASAQVTVTPSSGLSCGNYEAAVKITSDKGAEASASLSLTVTEVLPRLAINSTIIHTMDSHFSGTGYSWNAQSNTLTLTSEYEAGTLHFRDCDDQTITLQLTGDVTIEEPITALGETCINGRDAKKLIIDLGGHALTLRTGNNDNAPLKGESIAIRNGTLAARFLGGDTDKKTATIDAGTLAVEDATVIVDADSIDCGGIEISSGLILKQGAKVQISGCRGLYLSQCSITIESDDISLTAISTGISAIWLDGDVVYPTGSTLRYWTNSNAAPPSPAGEGTLLSSIAGDAFDHEWFGAKYVKIGTALSNAVVTGISVKHNPDKLVYTAEETLDLTGLVATLTYSDASTKDVPYTIFAANNITMTYEAGGTAAQGGTLGTAQDGNAIIVAVGSHTAHTNALTVKTAPKHTVAVTNGTGSGEYAAGTFVTITADTASEGKQFDCWTIHPSDVLFTEGTTRTPVAIFVMPEKAVAITAQWRYNGGGSHDEGNASPGGSGDATTPSHTVSGSTAITTATAIIGSDGGATASFTASEVSGAIEAAREAAQGTGGLPRVAFHVSGGSDINTVETTFPNSAVHAMATGNIASLMFSGPVSTMTFDARAIAAIANAAAGDVTFTASEVAHDALSDAARRLVGNRPVYDFRVSSGNEPIYRFDGTVTVSLPYTPAPGEDANAIMVYHINANGGPELIQNSVYDVDAGTLVFTTTHFSTYAVGYNKVVFHDVSDGAWYADAVSYLAARGITGGTTAVTFSPDTTLTRGQFTTLLMRAYGIDPDDHASDNFSDAGNTYYTGYLAAVKRLGISKGVGNHQFAPEQAVTRQEMFTLLYNALKAIDQLPEGDSGKTLSDFSDGNMIAPYAHDAMDCLVKTGAVRGNNGQLLPTATTTRAQMAQVLYVLLSEQAF